MPIKEITTEITKTFHNDCKNLNCLKPTLEPKATEHINEMIEMASSLIKKNHKRSKRHKRHKISKYYL